MSCEAIARVLLIDDDTIRTWFRLYQEDGIEGLASFGYEGGACRLTGEQQDKLKAWITETLANLPEDAIYPINLADETGKPLDGGSDYVLHFDKGATPPVNAFWSVTLYDGQGYQVANSLNRFAVSSWMPFKYNPDGSLDLYFQNANPGADKEANWLPAPTGPFNLTMRLYAPKSDALTGKWNPPPVMKEAQPTLVPAQ